YNLSIFFFFQAEDGIRDLYVTGVQTCALPILKSMAPAKPRLRILRSKELERSMRNLGFAGAMLFSNINGVGLNNDRFLPLYEAEIGRASCRERTYMKVNEVVFKLNCSITKFL